MRNLDNRQIQRVAPVILGLTLLFAAISGAQAQNTGWSIGLGLAGTTLEPEERDRDHEIEAGGIAIFGRWQHPTTGWGAMAELRAGEDDESFTEFDYGQLNLYATYTWRRMKLVRPFVKFGISSTGVELPGGASDDDTAGIIGGGLEVGRGRWAFHFSIDETEARIDVIDPLDRTAFSSSTLGATFRF